MRKLKLPKLNEIHTECRLCKVMKDCKYHGRETTKVKGYLCSKCRKGNRQRHGVKPV